MSSEVRSPRDLDLHGLGAAESMIPDRDFVDKGPSFECGVICDSGCDWCLVLLRETFWFHDCFGVDDCVWLWQCGWVFREAEDSDWGVKQS